MPSIFTEYLNKRIKELADGKTNHRESYPKARPLKPGESLTEWFNDRIQQLAEYSLIKPDQDGTDDSSNK